MKHSVLIFKIFKKWTKCPEFTYCLLSKNTKTNEKRNQLNLKKSKYKTHKKSYYLKYIISAEVKIAGHSTEYVNKVLEKVQGGGPSSAMDDF